VKAVVCRQFGPPESLTIEDLPSPRPGAGEVVVSVRAASLNFPDVLVIQNKYQMKPPLPFSPGSELAGVVKEVGADVNLVAPGDRVMAAVGVGAFAEEVAIDAAKLHRIPDGMPDEDASGFLYTYGTCEHALLDRGALQTGETLLVLGASGGIGIAAIEIGVALGARVIACASSEAKLAVCRQHGATGTIDYAHEDLRERIKALTDGKGVDVVCDAVGGPYTEPALRSTAWRGRLLVVGFAAGEIPKIPLNLVLLKGCAIVGVFWGEFVRREPALFNESVRNLCQWYAEGKLKPHISEILPLERAAEALQKMASRQVTGKIVLRVSAEL
jgi:NADPH:quinone reductase